MARTPGVRQRCTPDCPARCRSHRWEFHVELPAGEDGKRRQITRGGFSTARDAAEARAQVLGQHRAGTLPSSNRRLTVREYLETWYGGKVSSGALRSSTARSYRLHLDSYLLPHLGHLRLADLRAHHVERMFSAIRANSGGRRPMGPQTQRRVLATLRSAIREAVRRGEVTHDHTAHVTLAPAGRSRVQPWPAETFWRFVAYLEAQEDHSAGHRLLPLVLVTAGTGLRLGEVCGLRWTDVDLDRGVLHVRQQAQQVGSVVTYGKPKTRTGEDRPVPLVGWVPDTLRAWRSRQVAERLAWGEAWTDSGLVFSQPGGTPLVPFSVSKAYARLVASSGLPPCRFHDLRHLGASIMLQGGVPMPVVSRILGHSGIQVTVDTYGHIVLDEAVRSAVHQAFNATVPGTRTVP